MKPFATIRMYGGYDSMRKALLTLGATYTEENIYSNQFWGKAFCLEKFIGKGSQEKNRMLRKLADPIEYKEAIKELTK